jgi:hypothetical protein
MRVVAGLWAGMGHAMWDGVKTLSALLKYRPVAPLLLAALVATTQACIGNIGGDADADADGRYPQSCDPGTAQVNPVPLRRLSPEQYINSMRDLLGDPSLEIELEQSGEIITERAVRQLRDGAEIALSRRANWTKEVFPCDTSGAADQACVEAFVDGFARRAFRRPVSDDERAWLAGVYSSTIAQTSFEETMEVMLQVVLQSAPFFYLYEAGDQDSDIADIRRLSDYEVATRLSYFLWNTTPDDALLDAADAGELTGDGLGAQAERLLDDPRAEQAIQRFVSGWLQLDGGQLHHALEEAEKDADLFPEFDTQLASAMRVETEAFVKRVFFEEGASFDKLFTANFAYVNGPLADLYGVAGPADANTFEWVDLDDSERAGLLTRVAFLTVLSSQRETTPIRRGVWVLEEALCASLGDPPPDANDVAAEKDPGGAILTARQDTDARTLDDAVCASCHQLINPVGFAFENYDSIGRWQDDEVTTGLPVDATGYLAASDVDGELIDARDLSEKLARSAMVQQCFAKRFFKDALGSDLKVDSCSSDNAASRFSETGSMRELILGIIDSDAFRYISTSTASSGEEGQ